ncbi:MAG: hypothetical protein ACT4P5_19690, partial [Armatimonadota bacterium]
IAAQITATERELRDAAAWLGDPELYRDPERVKATRRQYEEAETRVADLYETLGRMEDETSETR